MNSKNQNSKRYLGELGSGYDFTDTSNLDREVILDRDFWRYEDTGNFLLYRRQRNPDVVSNTLPGKKSNIGVFGHRIGFANKESALRLGSGHFDAHSFNWNVIYELSAEASADVVDLRKYGEVPVGLFARHALQRAILAPGAGYFDKHDRTQDKPIITGRPLTRSLFAMDVGRDRWVQPAAFMHVPYKSHEVALNSIARRNIKQKR